MVPIPLHPGAHLGPRRVLNWARCIFDGRGRLTGCGPRCFFRGRIPARKRFFRNGRTCNGVAYIITARRTRIVTEVIIAFGFPYYFHRLRQTIVRGFCWGTVRSVRLDLDEALGRVIGDISFSACADKYNNDNDERRDNAGAGHI